MSTKNEGASADQSSALSAALAVASPLAVSFIICSGFIVWLGLSTARSVENAQTKSQSENVTMMSSYLQHLIDDSVWNLAALDKQLSTATAAPAAATLRAFRRTAASNGHLRSIVLLDPAGRDFVASDPLSAAATALLPSVAARITAGERYVTIPYASDDPDADLPDFLFAARAPSQSSVIVFVMAAKLKNRPASITVSHIDEGFALADARSQVLVPFGNRTETAAQWLTSERATLLRHEGVTNQMETRCTPRAVIGRDCLVRRYLENSSLIIVGFVDRAVSRATWIHQSRPFWLFAAFVMAGGAASSGVTWIWVRRRREDRRRLATALSDLKDAYTAKSNFMAHLSHELRTPLNSILGFSEVMKAAYFGPLDLRYRDYAKDIHTSALHLNNIASDIMDIERIERGELPPESGKADLNAIVTEAAQMLTMLATTRQVKVEVVTASGPALASISGHRAMQICTNLLSNAVKYSESEDRVTIGVQGARDGFVTLTVIDEGVGMTPEEIAYTERPFGQPADRRTARHDSVGLGLPIVRGLLAAVGGRLRIESKKHKGTTVFATFPAYAENVTYIGKTAVGDRTSV